MRCETLQKESLENFMKEGQELKASLGEEYVSKTEKLIQDYSNHKIDERNFIEAAQAIRYQYLLSLPSNITKIRWKLLPIISQSFSNNILNKNHFPDKEELKKNITIKKIEFDLKEQKPYYEYYYNGKNNKVYHTGQYVQSTTAEIQEVIDGLNKEDGILYHIEETQGEDPTLVDTSFGSFTLSNEGRPMINYDLLIVQRLRTPLAGLRHEFTHFKFWQRIRDEMLKENPTLDKIAANKMAFAKINNSTSLYAETEREAVKAELETYRLNSNSPFNIGLFRPVKEEHDISLIPRLNYPYSEAILLMLKKGKQSDPTLKELLIQFMKTAIEQALVVRKNAYNYYSPKQGKENKALFIKEQNLMELMFRLDISRYRDEFCNEELTKIYKEAIQSYDQSQLDKFKLSEDDDLLKILAVSPNISRYTKKQQSDLLKKIEEASNYLETFEKWLNTSIANENKGEYKLFVYSVTSILDKLMPLFNNSILDRHHYDFFEAAISDYAQNENSIQSLQNLKNSYDQFISLYKKETKLISTSLKQKKFLEYLEMFEMWMNNNLKYPENPEMILQDGSVSLLLEKLHEIPSSEPALEKAANQYLKREINLKDFAIIINQFKNDFTKTYNSKSLGEF